MALLDILKFPNPQLAKKSLPVDTVDAAITELIDDMFETMYEAEGVGLAAAQVGELKRIIVVDCGVREEPAEGEEDAPLQAVEPYAVINPVVTTMEGTINWEEGCLSVPGYTDEVERAAKVRVEGLDKHGEPLVIDAEGLLAVCLQHEIDHLEGVLFVDRLSRLKSSMVKKKLKKRAAEDARA